MYSPQRKKTTRLFKLFTQRNVLDRHPELNGFGMHDEITFVIKKALLKQEAIASCMYTIINCTMESGGIRLRGGSDLI